MPLFFNGISKWGVEKTDETTNGETGVGLPLERSSFSKAAFFHRQCTLNTLFF